MNRTDVREALLEKIGNDYKDDISFVVIHGSTIYGETHEKSDLDLYYLAKPREATSRLACSSSTVSAATS